MNWHMINAIDNLVIENQSHFFNDFKESINPNRSRSEDLWNEYINWQLMNAIYTFLETLKRYVF